MKKINIQGWRIMMIPKFRAWYGIEMYDEPVICNGEFYLDWRDFENGKTYDGAVLMQSTGFKDKNGVEIYESDLIKAEGIDGLFEVRRDNGGLYRLLKKGTPYGLRALIDWIGYVEVVGNVYENKEILE